MENGSNYILFIDTVTPTTAERGNPEHYRPVVCGTSNGLQLQFESISYRNKCDNGWDRTASGYGSWNFDLEGHAVGVRSTEKLLKANFQEIAMLAIKKKIFWGKMADVSNKIVREGLVRIGNYREQADMYEPYSFTASFVGIGEPIFETDFFTTVIATSILGNELLTDGNNNLIDINDEY